MAGNDIDRLLRFANLQMAAEAFLIQGNESAPANGNDLRQRLVEGNRHVSRFGVSQANQFATESEVLVQYRNDPLDPSGTGFSGTLFQDRATGDLTLSFRSTEFIEDAVRDSKSTNELEVKELGWALGQISEMERWYRELSSNGGPLEGRRFHVTGYSLGGHLATAFNILRQEEAQGNPASNPIIDTVTFNGAGVGGLIDGATLTGVIEEFDRLRALPAIQQSAEWASLSLAERTRTRNAAMSRLMAIESESSRIRDIAAPFAFSVRPSAGDQASLNYQIAAVLASRETIPVTRAPFAFTGVNWIPTSPVFAPNRINAMTEIVGSDGGHLGPSFVANSGIHHGMRQEVYIEDQPLTRGRYFIPVNQGSLMADPSVNDFADTHSLVLLVDSLSLLAVFERLDPAFTLENGRAILAAASSSGAETRFLSQGSAEGDTLERALDSLSRLILGAGTPPVLADYGPTLAGNTWHQVEYREPLHLRLDQLNRRIDDLAADAAFAPRLRLLTDLSPSLVVELASNDTSDGLAYRYALRELNSYAVLGFGYEQHNADGSLDLDDGFDGSGLTIEWLEARADMLAARIRDHSLDGNIASGLGERFEDAGTGIRIGSVSPAVPRTVFGTGSGESIAGGLARDRLFGAGGADTLSGGGGADYLEGGLGDDHLDGGAGRDFLVGGAGFDTYVHGAGDGMDRIFDADGAGVVIHDGRVLAGGEEVAPGVYKDSAGTRYVLVQSPDGEGELVIDGSLALEDFASGMLGIALGSSTDPWTPPSSGGARTYSGGPYPDGQETSEDDRRLGVANYLGSNVNDFVTSAGASLYMTRGGDDTIRMSGIANVLAGAGRDTIDARESSGTPAGYSIVGGAGDDWILGSAFADRIYGDNLDVDLHPFSFAAKIDGFVYDISAPAANQQDADSTYIELLQRSGSYVGSQMLSNPHHDYTPLILAEDWYLPGGLPDALAYVQGADPTFDDYIDAGDGDDIILPGSGGDIVFGGAGDDRISGDGGLVVTEEISVAFGESVALLGAPGDDYLDGGEGDDHLSDETGGSDTLLGGEGDDEFLSYERDDAPMLEAFNLIDGGPGNDHVFAVVAPCGFDVVIGGEGDDDITVIGLAHVDGGMGNDTLDMTWGTVRDEGGIDTLNDGDSMLPFQAGVVGEVEFLMFDPDAASGSAHIEVSRSGDDLVYSMFGSAVDETDEGVEYLEFDNQLVFVDWFSGPDYRIERIGSMSAEQFERWGSAQVGGLEPGSYVGGEYVDRIAGSAGDDAVSAGAGADLVSGRGGDDFLDGGHGDDTYFYARGHGDDVITDARGDDQLRLGPGIAVGDVSLAFEDDSLVLRVAGGSITFAGVGPGDVDADLPVERLVFTDGAILEVATIAAALPPPAGVPAQNPPPIAEMDFPPPGDAPVAPAVPDPVTVAGTVSNDLVPVASVTTASGVTGAPQPSIDAGLSVPDSPVTIASPARASPSAPLAYEAMTQASPSDVPPSIGISADPVYREIDARLDVLLQAGRMNLSERYAEAIQEFERRRTGEEGTPAPPPSNEEVARWNERVHDWHARHPTFEPGAMDGIDGAWTAGWNGIASGGHALDELVGAAGSATGANPNALGRVSGVRPAPGLSEGVAELRG